MKKALIIFSCFIFVVSCNAATYVVDSNGLQDFATIKAAVAAAGNNDVIIVNPGTYAGSDNRCISLDDKAITIRSINPKDSGVVASTVIDCGFSIYPGFGYASNADAVIAGFTITNSNTSGIKRCDCTITDCVITGNSAANESGGGMFMCNGKIIDCIITSNSAEFGGGLSMCDANIIGCAITNNAAGFTGGGLYLCDANIIGGVISDNTSDYDGGGLQMCSGNIIDVTINDNTTVSESALGAGISEFGGDITGCTISDNNIGAISFCKDMDITESKICGNKSQITGSVMEECYNVNLLNCVITGNSNADGIHAVRKGDNIKFDNCTIAGNRGVIQRYNEYITNCIITKNLYYYVPTVWPPGQSADWAKYATYSCLYAPIESTISETNIEVDPDFAVAGSWDANGTPGDTTDDFWIEGDYHVKSQAGRWDPATSSWVADVSTSPCIDAGDAASDWTDELWPHGKHINIGAYGGTTQASMSLSTVGNIADMDNNDAINYIDLMMLADKWLYQQILLPEDLNRNGVVDFLDFAVFAEQW